MAVFSTEHNAISTEHKALVQNIFLYFLTNKNGFKFNFMLYLVGIVCVCVKYVENVLKGYHAIYIYIFFTL